jgi:excisionase family DNA binding protein
MLGIGRTKLYELIGTGEIEVFKLGKISLIPVRALEEFVARQQPVPTRFTGIAKRPRGRPRATFVELAR